LVSDRSHLKIVHVLGPGKFPDERIALSLVHPRGLASEFRYFEIDTEGTCSNPGSFYCLSLDCRHTPFGNCSAKFAASNGRRRNFNVTHFTTRIAMNCHISLRNGVVYMPTMGKMGKGFYRAVEPVAVVLVENTEALRQALKATIARGNPTVPQPQRRDDWPPPVVLKYARVKSWSAFERGRRVWDIKENDGVFLIAGNTTGPYGWVEDQSIA
jgi:hypothetical protein